MRTSNTEIKALLGLAGICAESYGYNNEAPLLLRLFDFAEQRKYTAGDHRCGDRLFRFSQAYRENYLNQLFNSEEAA